MKGTSSSEARRQCQNVQASSDKKRQTSKKLDSCSGDKKQSSSTSRSLKKGQSFKRSYRIRCLDVNAHRETCSSLLKDSKFTKCLTLTPPGVLKLCTYTYCSLNAHLHREFPPLISARRRFLKSHASVKTSGDGGCVDVYVDEKKENGSTGEIDIQLVLKTEETLLTLLRKHCKREECSEDWREFNPREPNYLPISSEPSSEMVKLKHQDMDERKNAEEWMIDYALQHTISKLALERKKKVALLIEAFETILPTEPSQSFTYGRHLQACN
ncbi:Calmodulin binding protein PICBP [Cardamine amara subsp. amara]|uniref:Calmodulin binding protein PICBP n=1 Tax=Cardamine amara subsp. amara TaxID=228776 RepID=A0ABD1B6U3_CARAN